MEARKKMVCLLCTQTNWPISPNITPGYGCILALVRSLAASATTRFIRIRREQFIIYTVPVLYLEICYMPADKRRLSIVHKWHFGKFI